MPQKKKPSKAKPPGAKRTPKRINKAAPEAAEGDFLAAFAALLKRKKVAIPKGLEQAPQQAYASQTASLVEQLERLPNAELKRFAEKVAGYTARQGDRAKREWDSSPLIVELRRRRLEEPPTPSRPTGASVSLAKPLADWSDREIVDAAQRWSKLGR